MSLGSYVKKKKKKTIWVFDRDNGTIKWGNYHVINVNYDFVNYGINSLI